MNPRERREYDTLTALIEELKASGVLEEDRAEEMKQRAPGRPEDPGNSDG